MLLLALLLGASAADRVVAIGDLHGDLSQTLRALALAELIDAQGHWAGGDTVLVQTGDTMDRGPDSRWILELLQRLEGEAAESGGRVVCLLGNHEVMNLQGDLRYVLPADTEAFGGAAARRDALEPGGSLGAWLRTLPALARVGDTVFVHGGLRPELAELGLEQVNAQVHEAITAGGGAILGPSGPLWYRGYARDPEAQACEALARALAHLDAGRMVVGHTPSRDGTIRSRCGGRLHAIDVGMAAYYGSHLAVWEELDGDARARTPAGIIDLPDP